MKQSPQEQNIASLIRPVIEDLGFELYCLKITGEDGACVLQIMAEDPKTKRLGIDDCTKISRSVSAVMDVEDPIKSAYRLEISSPGIDRILIKPEHFAQYMGFEAKIETDIPNENGQKRFRGILGAVENNSVQIETDTGPYDIAIGSIHKAKLVLTDRLIKETANLNLNQADTNQSDSNQTSESESKS
ncbi:MAG: ribosome maturation factor RimP [Alphaproteobacteria bacterium]